MTDPMFFDRMASVYENARPHYPAALYERLARLGVLRRGIRVLEVGAGTGQATEAFVRAGARVVALEPGPALAARLRQRFPGVRIIGSTLEDADLGERSFDAAIFATAFHWIDPEIGLPKLHTALVPGGVLAVWRTVFGDPDVQTPFRERLPRSSPADRTHASIEDAEPLPT